MKRYKDCSLVCNDNQHAYQLLEIIEQVAKEKNYKTHRQDTLGKKDTLIVYIKAKDLPYSRIVIIPLSTGAEVSIANVIPMPDSGESHIGYTVYNRLLNIFRDDVFVTISQKYGNKIKENNEDYIIQEVIPKSYPLLETWLNAYPLSGHTLDTHRWFDFLIALHQNDEHLSLDDFGKYLAEKYNWDEDDIERFELRLESQLELLEYYDSCR